MAKSERLFVGNLPENIVDQELKNEFGAYGSVQSVELKTKKDVDDPSKVINTFAFITLNIDPGALRRCKFLNRLSSFLFKCTKASSTCHLRSTRVP